jgi:hypothetical protein
MSNLISYENVINDIHNGKYRVKSIKSAYPDAEKILSDYIADIPEEIDAVVEHAKAQGYTFSEFVSLVAQSSVKKGLRIN